jgi:hypothetical protein
VTSSSKRESDDLQKDAHLQLAIYKRYFLFFLKDLYGKMVFAYILFN